MRIGLEYEAGLSAAARTAGAHYTPQPVASLVVRLGLDELPDSVRVPSVFDPACGAGALLVAAADALVVGGVDPVTAITRVSGVDTDPGAVDAARRALVAWGEEHGIDVTPRVGVADGLATRDTAAVATVDLVVGNPPFRSQLRSRTAADVEERRLRATDFGAAGGGYADLSGLFLLSALRRVRSGGVVSMLQPRSLIAARDAGPTRDEIGREATLASVWLPDAAVFGASVDVIAVQVSRRPTGGRPEVGPVRVLAGAGAEPRDLVERSELNDSWAPLLAGWMGVPVLDAPGGAELGDTATATAGFRDLFYAVSPHVREATLEAPVAPARTSATEVDSGLSSVRRVATVGMVDPGEIAWGRRRVRIGGRQWTAPQVALAEVTGSSPGVSAWLGRLAAPRVLVAAQTRVIEAAVDLEGRYVPLTPLIVVSPRDTSAALAPWLILAALSAPPATAWAWRRFGGAGFSSAALKLAARQVLRIPVPTDSTAWTRAAVSLAAGSTVEEVGAELCRAWRVDDALVLDWWRERLPRR